MEMTTSDKMRIIDRNLVPHPSLYALRYMRSLISHEHLKMTRASVGCLGDQEAMALPHLIVLSNAESEPFLCFVAARWLHLNQLAKPAAIATFIELAFDDHKEIAFEALALLEASRDQQALDMLQALVKSGREIPQKVSQILTEVPSTDDDSITTESQAQPAIAQIITADSEHHQSKVPSSTSITLKQQPPSLAMPLTIPHPIIWHEPVLSSLPGVGPLVRRLPYNYEKPHRFPLFIFALTIIAELLTRLSDPRFGILVHFSTLMVLFYNVVVAKHKKLRRLHTALLLIPLVRLVSYGLPLSTLPQLSSYFAASVPLFAAMGVIVWQEEWQREELGLTLRALPLQLLMGVVGIGLGWLEYQILKPLPLVPELTWQALWLPALILMLSSGYLEELLFRGLLQSAAIPIMGRWPAVIFVAFLFAALHIGYASLLDLLFVFTVGLSFGLFVLDTRSLLGVTLAHGLINISLFLLWPLWLK